MKKIILTIVCLTMAMLLFTACGKSEKETDNSSGADAALVGTWEADFFVDAGYVFTEDLSGMDIFWNMPFTYTTKDGVITISYTDTTYAAVKYNYSISGTTLKLTAIDDETDVQVFERVTSSSRTEVQTEAGEAETGESETGESETAEDSEDEN